MRVYRCVIVYVHSVYKYKIVQDIINFFHFFSCALDEGEEFKVKKSSHSRKIAMQLKQENLKEKETKDIGIKYERKEISEKKVC